MEGLEKSAEDIEKKTWSTWEELLLACAVKRHGLSDWDSIAMELQNRSSTSIVFTAQICREKFQNLKNRFTDKTDEEPDDTRTGDEGDSIPWIEELRKLRVAELKQEVHRYDLSIESLQSKVKRLEEEREQSLKENENDVEKPDLEKDMTEERSENDKKDGTEAPAEVLPENVAGKTISSEYSGRDNRSFNESNSTENREKTDGRELEPVGTRAVKTDLDSKPVRADSCNDSSDTVAKQAASKPSQLKKVEAESTELVDSAAESKEGVKESSDVQSSASLTKMRRQRVEVTGGTNGGNEPVGSPATMKRDFGKPEPLVCFLDIIRKHKHGSMFERRLESQKTDKYKNIVRQHVDLETVQTRIHDGSYTSCTAKFYLDLLLLFNNAIVFFPKSSSKSVAAHKLRNLVLKELKKNRINRQPDPSPEPPPLLLQPKPDPEKSDSLLAKQKSSAPIIVCRKRSSISLKPSTSSKVEKQTEEKPKPPVKSPITTPKESEEVSSMKVKEKEKERLVTGARSLRKSSNRSTNHVMNSSSNQGGVTNKVEAPKGDKKKADVSMLVKKRGAADFLKRIKKNSPEKGTVVEMVKRSEDGSRRDQQKKRVEERREETGKRKNGGGKHVSKEESSPSKRGVGRPPKRGKEAVPVKRGREGREVEVGSKRPKKRSRR